MQELALLESLRGHSARNSRWPEPLEQQFRHAQRHDHRLPRLLLFSVHAACIGGAPLYGRSLFRLDDRFEPWFSLALIAVGLLFALTAAMTWRAADLAVSKVFQVICVFIAGLGAVWMHYLSLQGLLNFPAHLVSVVIVSLLIFGGYAWKRMAIGATCCLSLAALMQLRFNPDTAAAGVQMLCLGLMAQATITHVALQERIARRGWIDHRYANAVARTDQLTGLSTRTHFNQVFDSRLAQARRDRCRIAVLMLDIDHFKRVNDSYGHLFGDEVLRAVGGVILDGFARRPLDLRVRFGGEEMVILWYDVGEQHLPALGENLLAAIRRIELIDPASGAPVHITASIGITSMIPDAQPRTLDLLRKADELLYQAKAQGRNRIVIEPFRIASSRRAD